MSEPVLRPLPERMRAIPTLVNKQRVYVVTEEQIREVERILATIDAQRWVPVTERVPEKGVPILYWFDPDIRDWKPAAYMGAYLGMEDGLHGFGGRHGFNYGPEVTHWMPLPAAPEVE